MRDLSLPTTTLFAILAFTACDRTNVQTPPQSAALGEQSAINLLLSTQYVASLSRQIPSRKLICMLDYVADDGIHLYLGDDEGDHATRIGFYRVTRDGKVWINANVADPERWVAIK